MILGLADIGGIFGQLGLFGHHLRGAQCNAVELGNALGNGIDVIIELGAHGVEHFVHGDKSGALEIPMRLLGHECQIDGVGEASVEDIDHRLAGVVVLTQGN